MHCATSKIISSKRNVVITMKLRKTYRFFIFHQLSENVVYLEDEEVAMRMTVRSHSTKRHTSLWGKQVKTLTIAVLSNWEVWNRSADRIWFNIFVRVNFGHQMWVGFCLWAIELTRVVRKIPHFVWGAIPMSFPVFWISVSGRSLNSYGTIPNSWVKKKLVKFR